MGTELFHTEGRKQTDMTHLIVALRNFANALIKYGTETDCEISTNHNITLRTIQWQVMKRGLERSQQKTVK